MDVVNYIERAEVIRKKRLMDVMQFAKELDMSFVTLYKLKNQSGNCSFKTLRKLKAFVDKYDKE